METLNEIKELEKLQRVEAPPFLMTRIRAKIDAMRPERLAPQWAFATGLAFALLLAVNISLLNSRQESSVNSNIEEIANNFDLMTSNQLYHE